jgi:hypothetical protein
MQKSRPVFSSGRDFSSIRGCGLRSGGPADSMAASAADFYVAPDPVMVHANFLLHDMTVAMMVHHHMTLVAGSGRRHGGQRRTGHCKDGSSKNEFPHHELLLKRHPDSGGPMLGTDDERQMKDRRGTIPLM